jgi:hypothetical protein
LPLNNNHSLTHSLAVKQQSLTHSLTIFQVKQNFFYLQDHLKSISLDECSAELYQTAWQIVISGIPSLIAQLKADLLVCNELHVLLPSSILLWLLMLCGMVC